MKTEGTTLNRLNSMKILSLFLILLFVLSCFSCMNKRERYLKNAIKWDAEICPLINSGNSEIILVCVSAQGLIDKLSEDFKLNNPEEYLYMQMKNGSPINVSRKYYDEALKHNYRICADSVIDSIYKKNGVSGLIKKYFKIGLTESDTDKTFILWNEEERFPLVGKKPYPAFGQNTNRDYLIYLLSKHNIYFNSIEIDHISMIILSEELSDMSEVKFDN